MEAAVNQNYIVDNYWNLLKNLSDNVKLALISKLSSSITTKKEEKAENLKLSDFYGSMADVPFPSIEEIRDTMKDEDKDCTAVANGMTMVTDNIKDFKNIRGIKIENWIR